MFLFNDVLLLIITLWEKHYWLRCFWSKHIVHASYFANVSSFANKLKVVANVSPSIVYFMGNLIMGVTSYGVVPSLCKLVGHDHVFHDKRVVHSDQYPSKESLLDDDVLNEHFDAKNGHQQQL